MKQKQKHDKIEKIPYLVGITGGIASGKTVITEYLRKKNFPIISADHLGYQVLAVNTSSYTQIVETFGQQILNQDLSINRKILGEIVFSDRNELQKLNKISHPEIQQMVLEIAPKLHQHSESGWVFLEAALLIEAKWYEVCHSIWVIATPPQIGLHRMLQRDQISEKQAKARMASQLTAEERKPYADVYILNDQTLVHLYREVDIALTQLLASV